MASEDFFCEEECMFPAKLFYLDKGLKRKVCHQHAAGVTQPLYPIGGFHFISTEEDANLYLERLLQVKKGRSYLEKIREKADEELVAAIEDLDSVKNKAIHIVSETYEIAKRRTQQLHFQIGVGLEQFKQEFNRYLKNKEFETSKTCGLLMTDLQLVPSMLNVMTVDISLELVNTVLSGFCIAELPLEQHLAAVLDQEQSVTQDQKWVQLALDENQTDFIEFQRAFFHATATCSSERQMKLMEKLLLGLNNRKEVIKEINTKDVNAVSEITEGYWKEIKSLEISENWDQTGQLYVLAISYLSSFSCSKKTAELYSHYADFLVTGDRLVEAETYFSLALDILKHHFPDNIETADTYEKLGTLYVKQQKLEDAQSCYLSAVALRKTDLPDDHGASRVFYKLGDVYHKLQRYEEALEVLSSALDIQRVSDPDQRKIVSILILLGKVLSDLNRYEEALPYYTEAITEETPNTQAQANLYMCLGFTFEILEQNAQADQSYESAWAIYKFLPLTTIANLSNLSILGKRFVTLGRFQEAEFCYQVMVTVQNTQISDIHNVAYMHYTLGNIRFRLNMKEKSVTDYNAALRILVSHFPMDTLTALTHFNLGLANQELTRLSKAEYSYKRVMDILKTIAPLSKLNLIAYVNLGELLTASKRLQEAENHYRGFVLLLESQFPNEIVTALMMLNLGMIYAVKERFSDAQDCHRKAVEILERDYPSEVALIASTHFWSGKILSIQKHLPAGLKTLNGQTNALLNSDESFRNQVILTYDYPVEHEELNQPDQFYLFPAQGVFKMPNFINMYQLLGRFLLNFEHYDESERYLIAALDLEKANGNESVALIGTLKELYLKTNQMEKLRNLGQNNLLV